METTFTFLKQNGLMAAALPVLLYLQFDTRGEIRDLRADMVAGHQAIRAEMAADHQHIRAEMAEEFEAVRSDLSDLRERMARVETRLEGIENRLYMDTARPPM